MTRVRAARRAARSHQVVPTRTATTRRSSCRPEGQGEGMHYRISLVDTPRLAFLIYQIVSRNCPLTQIILPKAGRIRIYQAPRNSTADMPVRLRSGSCCRDTLSLPITDDDDDEDALEACIVSVNKILEHSLTHLLTVTNAIKYIDSTTDTHKRRIEHNVLSCLLGNVRK